MQDRGILPDTVLGWFFREHLKQALALCERYPDLHILSETKDGTANKFIPDALAYTLGNGDRNPCIQFVPKPLTVEHFQRVYEQLSQVPESGLCGAERFMLAWSESVLEGAAAFDAKNILRVAKNG